jgi:3-hydroxybutyryl-CoA dehydrogenase
MEVNTLCLVGAGTMGTGIAQVAAQAGLRVCLMDVSETVLTRSRERLERSLREGIERGKLTPEQAAEVRQRLTWGVGCDCLSKADWVIEAVFEGREAKREVLGQLGRQAREGVPIATNTSTFPIHELAPFSRRPEHFLGMHFSNPAPVMKLVEIIPGPQTLPEVTAAALALCERMDKTAQVAPDIPGFLVNRAFGALVAAALDMWVQGAAPEVIDNTLELGLGHRMGPLKTADLVGLDVMLALLRSLHEQTGHARFEAPAEFVRLVESGKLGRKSGEGFYRYEG